MKVIVNRNTRAGGKSIAASDKPQEIADVEARKLISAGKAVAVKDDGKKGAKADEK